MRVSRTAAWKGLEERVTGTVLGESVRTSGLEKSCEAGVLSSAGERVEP